MASDNQASYAKIGFSLVLGVVLALGALIYLGGVRDVTREFPAETFFVNGVSGLSVGSDVNYRGVKVGRVDKIDFLWNVYPDRKDIGDREQAGIWVRMALDRRLWGLSDDVDTRAKLEAAVARGLCAMIAANAVTGLARIELATKPEFPSRERPAFKASRHPFIPPMPSLMESAGDAADRILAQIDKINLVDGWTNIVGSLASAQNVLNAADTILQTESGKISDILDNIREASSSLRDFADQIRGNPGLLLRANDPEALPETR
ncbi:MAG: MlaD family protein [Kiritimatiellia bacterium]